MQRVVFSAYPFREYKRNSMYANVFDLELDRVYNI